MSEQNKTIAGVKQELLNKIGASDLSPHLAQAYKTLSDTEREESYLKFQMEQENRRKANMDEASILSFVVARIAEIQQIAVDMIDRRAETSDKANEAFQKIYDLCAKELD